MSDFNGMALYEIDEIRSALENYRTTYNKVNQKFKDKASVAEEKYTPTRWGKFWHGNTLKDYHSNDNNWENWYCWLYDRGFITLTEKELDLVRVVNSSYRFYMDRFETEYSQVKDLFNGGKACYLSPMQSRMVNEFKEKK